MLPLGGMHVKHALQELIAYFPLIRHGPPRKLKNYGGRDIDKEQGDLISLITKIKGDIQTDRKVI
jgi:hypothetical protein